jgi:hypothetical protein
MGLDWVLMRRKPKKGAARQFAELTERLAKARGKAKTTIARLEKQLDAVSTRAEEAIGAPRVGVDERATAWWREHVYAPNAERALLRSGTAESIAYWSRPQAVLLREAKGKFVCELATEQGGRQQAGSWSLVSDIDYPGIGVLGAADFDFLGELSSEAWVDHDAKEAAHYAAQLRGAVASALGEGTLELGATQAATVEAAAQWLEFWSKRGFGFHAWF